MFGSQSRPADRTGSSFPNEPVKDAPKMADQAKYRPLKPSEPVWKSTEPSRTFAAQIGLPGPTAVVDRHFRGAGTPSWAIVAEVDRTVVVRKDAAAQGEQ